MLQLQTKGILFDAIHIANIQFLATTFYSHNCEFARNLGNQTTFQNPQTSIKFTHKKGRVEWWQLLFGQSTPYVVN